MKRLKDYLLNMNSNSTTYVEMYEGKMSVAGATIYTSTYWYGEIGFNIERTHKLALDKPTITISIPITMLNLNQDDCKYVAAGDYILRGLKKYFDELNEGITNRNRPDKENGKYYIYSPGGEVLKRNCVYFKEVERRYYSVADYDRLPEMCVNIITQVQFPYKRIKKIIQMLTKSLPMALDRFVADFDVQKLREAIALNKKQKEMREWLRNSQYCAFVANGAILPRKGNSALPADNAVPFTSPQQNEIEVCGMKGMGIKKGVTVITGGGYSGKSTLLDAISAGIYDHIRGDGREFVVTDESAIKISAEDGRSVKNVNLSPFIKWLPNGGDTSRFSTEHASGSTSQAANIIEAVNFGAKLFLIDEDKSATNFMIRDDMMKELIKREPITPFTDRVRQLYNEAGISTILVVGGSGEYLSVADSVIMMDEFNAFNATEQARSISEKYKTSDNIQDDTGGAAFREYTRRKIRAEGFSTYPSGNRSDEYSGKELLEISDMGFIMIGDERIDIRMLHNIVSFAQLTAIGYIIRHLALTNKEAMIDIESRINELYAMIDESGLESLYSNLFQTEKWLDIPRKYEVIAVINRMRFVNFG